MFRTCYLLHLYLLFVSLTVKAQDSIINSLSFLAQDSIKSSGYFPTGQWRQGFLNRDGLIENYNGKEIWLSLYANGQYEFEACNRDDSCAKVKGKWQFNDKTNTLNLDSGLLTNEKRDYTISIPDSGTFLMQEINLSDKNVRGYKIVYHKLKKPAKKKVTTENQPNHDTYYTQNNDPKLLIGHWYPCSWDKIGQPVDSTQTYYAVFDEDFNFYYIESFSVCGTHDVLKWEYYQESDILFIYSHNEIYHYKVVRLDSTTLIMDFANRKTGAIIHRQHYRKYKF